VDDADQVVVLERGEHVLLITLNRPDVRNAVNAAVANGIAAGLVELDEDPELRVGILTGAPPGFCSGMDLKAYLAGESPWIPDRGFAGIAQRGSHKPLIAAVEGFAMAGGFEIALACDLIVAARGTRFAIPEVKRGLFAGAGALIHLPRRIPHNIAVEMALTGDPVLAERLYDFGLVNRLSEPGGALDAARELAAAIIANSPLAIRTTKEALRRNRDLALDAAWEQQNELWATIFASPDAREGALAFAEKRAPKWQTS
jgi:enoyl-CoA hydratase